jgi:hypothetical protein
MNPYLRASLICLIVCALCVVVWLQGCSQGIMGACRHDSTLAIAIAGEKWPVRVVVGDRQGALHSQAQAWIDGKWEWLVIKNGAVYQTAKDDTFKEQSYYIPWVWFGMVMNYMVKENRPPGW